MNERQENTLIEHAKNWYRTGTRGRTSEEKSAYLQAVEDTLTAIFEGTYHGAYPAHKMYDTLEEIFEEE